MIGGLLVAAIATVLPLAIVGPAAFIVLRAVTGLGAAAYDPAARGYLVDTMHVDAEMFGLYGSAQFGGFVIGPAVGQAAALTGEPTSSSGSPDWRSPSLRCSSPGVSRSGRASGRRPPTSGARRQQPSTRGRRCR